MAKKIKIKVSPWFKDSYRSHKENNPEIENSMTEFNLCKREQPPRPLPPGMKDHRLKGKLSDYRECHLAPNVLLLYTHEKGCLTFLDVCEHNDLKGPKEAALARKIKKFLN